MGGISESIHIFTELISVVIFVLLF